MICYFIFAMALTSTAHGWEIQGHRGSRGTLPENTLPSFHEAIEAGADGIEMDLLLTRDGEIVIHHDFFMNPRLCTHLDGTPLTTNDQLIKETFLAELKQLDCGRLQHPGFPQQIVQPGSTIPTLKELFDFLKRSSLPHAKKIRLNLEIKADPLSPEFIPSYAKVAEKVVQQVHESRMTDQVYFSSFDLAILAEIRKIDAQATLGIILETESLEAMGIDPKNWVDAIILAAKKLGATIVSPDFALLSKRDIESLHKEQLRVIPWTVNDLHVSHQLIEMGVDGLITDYPRAMMQLRK